MKCPFILAFMLFFALNTFGQQNVAINNDGSPPNPSAILDVQSNEKGILIPRMTTIERENIQNPPAGLMVYDIDIESFFYHTGINGIWKNMLANLELPYFENFNNNGASFHIQNAEPSSDAITGQFTSSDGTGVYAHSGNIGGRFWGGTTGIDVIGGGNDGYAGKFYSANGSGVHIDMNGDTWNALVVDRGRTGLGTITPSAKLHVRDANASNGNTTGEAIFKASAYQPSIPDEMNLEYWIAQPAGGEPNEPYFGMRSNHRLNLVSNNNTSNPEISILDNKVGINKKDGTYPLSINGKTAIYEDNIYMGEVYGDGATGDLYINALKAISGMDGFFSKNLILQPHFDGKKAGKVGINMNSPNAFLEVGKGNFPFTPAAKFGNSKFDEDDKNSTSISGGNSDANIVNRGALVLNADVTAPVKIATGGGNVLMSHPDTKLSIGTEDDTYPLNVKGTIRSAELIVETGWWPDYVFAKDYNLKPIEEVEKYIVAHNHLPNVPPASEIQENGLKVSEISTKMMEKIEEMMLYIIEQNKQIRDLQHEVSELKNKK
jgi:hypothetical protein